MVKHIKLSVLEHIEFDVKRARAVLKEYGLPTTQQGLANIQIGYETPIPDFCVHAAVAIVGHYEALLTAIEESDIERALTNLYIIMSEREDLSFYTSFPNERIARHSLKFRKDPNYRITSDSILNKRFEERSEIKKNGPNNKFTPEYKEHWQELANNLYVLGEDNKKSLAYKVLNALEEEDPGTRVKVSGIRNYIKKPS